MCERGTRSDIIVCVIEIIIISIVFERLCLFILYTKVSFFFCIYFVGVRGRK